MNTPTSISFAYLEELCRMEEESEMGICQDGVGWDGGTGASVGGS
jgi:hypothetical protein